MSTFIEHFTTPSGIEMNRYTETRPWGTAIIGWAHGLNYEVKPMRAGYVAEITDDGDLLIYHTQLCATETEAIHVLDTWWTSE